MSQDRKPLLVNPPKLPEFGVDLQPLGHADMEAARLQQRELKKQGAQVPQGGCCVCVGVPLDFRV